jgi:hypothetical protein
MNDRSCAVDGCGRTPRSPKADLCNAHYFRMWRYGRTGTAEISDRKRKPCSVEDCPDLANGGLGLCSRHYQRLKTHGDTQVVLPPPSGEANRNWKGNNCGYGAAHDRVRRARGLASTYPCSNCRAPAKHWAYDHGDPNELVSPLGPYSAQVQHYLPMCVPCHKAFDLRHLQACRSSPA